MAEQQVREQLEDALTLAASPVNGGCGCKTKVDRDEQSLCWLFRFKRHLDPWDASGQWTLACPVEGVEGLRAGGVRELVGDIHARHVREFHRSRI